MRLSEQLAGLSCNSAGDAGDWRAVKATIASDMNALVAQVAEAKHEHGIKQPSITQIALTEKRDLQSNTRPPRPKRAGRPFSIR
jgi:hypothetical protein